MADIDQYDYHLPRELIAQSRCRRSGRPAAGGTARQRNAGAPPRPRSGRVLAAGRLPGAERHPRGSGTAGRLPDPDQRPLDRAVFWAATAKANWRILAKTRGKIKPGETMTLVDRRRVDVCRLMLLDQAGKGRLVRAAGHAPKTHWDLLDRVGRVPLPPYIRDGEMVDSDRETYQTVYADKPGAVAAPTAGLHFTAAAAEAAGGRRDRRSAA